MTTAHKTPPIGASAESTISAKGQTTIPGAVRKRLGLQPGDTLRYEVTSDGTVQLRKARKIDLVWLQAVEATLTEWHGDGDDDL
jgi:AbrB family looped-hinge helix DNA binding protein